MDRNFTAKSDNMEPHCMKGTWVNPLRLTYPVNFKFTIIFLFKMTFDWGQNLPYVRLNQTI